VNQKEEAIEMGRKLLETNARSYKLNLKSYKDKLESMLPDFNVSQMEDLFARIGFGKISPRQVLKKLEPGRVEEQEGEESGTSRVTQMVNKVLRRSDTAIQVNGYDDLLVYRAQCCNPIRGEEIIGYITTGRGISVHSVDCPSVEKLLLNPEWKVQVKWTADGEKGIYSVRLLISTEDRTGILADVTSAVSQIDTNIVNVNAQTVDDRYGVIDMTVEISDIHHLGEIMDCLKAIEGVREVERATARAKERRRG
jgi:GTP pyrophosphokinase